jgi:hypothetical protein
LKCVCVSLNSLLKSTNLPLRKKKLYIMICEQFLLPRTVHKLPWNFYFRIMLLCSTKLYADTILSN